MHKLCGCICSLVLQQWASFASKQKGLGAIALGKDQPGDANGDACLQIPRRACCMCCVTLRRGLLFEDPKIQIGDMKLQDLETKIQIFKQSPIIAFLPLTKLDNGSMSPLQHSCATPPCQIVCIIFIVYYIYSFMLYLSMHAISHIGTFNGNKISHF